MYLEVVSVRDGFRLHLLDSGKRVCYAGFDVLVRKGFIARYTFDNFSLTPNTFHYYCRYVSSLTLIWLKRHANSGRYLDDDFEFR